VNVPVAEECGGAVHDMRKRSLHQPPSGNSFDGFGQAGAEAELDVLHQDFFEGLKRQNNQYMRASAINSSKDEKWLKKRNLKKIYKLK